MARHRALLCAVRLAFLVLASLAVNAWSDATSPEELDATVASLIRAGNFGAAATILSERMHNGDAMAAYQLGKLHRQQLTPGTNHKQRAFTAFKHAADGGVADAMYQTGRAFEKGIGVEKDPEAARKWYAAAAAENHARANRSLEQMDERRPADRNPEAARDAVVACSLGALERSHALHSQSDLSHLAMHCDNALAILEVLVAKGVRLGSVDHAGDSLLHKAIASRDARLVEFLINRGLKKTTKNRQGWTPEMLAVRSGDEALLSLLEIPHTSRSSALRHLDEALGSKRFEGWSRLSVAAWQGDTDLVKRVLASKSVVDSVSEADATGHTPINRAVTHQHYDVAIILLDHGATIDHRDLAKMFNSKDERLLAEVIERVGQDPETLETFGCSAVRAGIAPLVQKATTLRWRADKTCKDHYPLTIAAKQGWHDVVDVLLASRVDVNNKDSAGCSALCWAIRNGHEEIASAIWQYGTDNLSDKSGVTPFMHAARHGHETLVKGYVLAQVNVNKVDKAGNHALLLAAGKGHTAIAELLLDAQARIDLKNSAGDTALIVAVRMNHFDVAEMLVRRDASIGAKNFRLESAQSLAQKKDEERWQRLFAERSGFWDLVRR